MSATIFTSFLPKPTIAKPVVKFKPKTPKSILRVGSYFGIECSNDWSLNQIRQAFRERTEKYKNSTTELDKTCLSSYSTETIHFTQLPHWFNYNHILTILTLVSDFDLRSESFRIDIYKDATNRKLFECLLSFSNHQDCRKVFEDLQCLQIFGTPIKIEIASDYTLLKSKELSQVFSTNVEHLNKAARLFIAQFLLPDETTGDTKNDVIVIKDSDDDDEDDMVRANEESDQVYKTNVSRTTSCVEQESFEEDNTMNSKENSIETNDLFYEDLVGAQDEEENENNCKIVSFQNMISYKRKIIKILIQQRIGKSLQYGCRSVKDDTMSLWKFPTHEDAVNVCNKLNGLYVQGMKIKVELALGYEYKFRTDNLNTSKINYKVKRKIVSDKTLEKKTKPNEISATGYATPTASHILKPPQERHNDLYGLSPNFLTKLGISMPLNKVIIVANLYSVVDDMKLFEVFSLAGVVRKITRISDYEGHKAKIVYDHPMEAVQAISMFHNHQLYDKTMNVKMDAEFDDSPPQCLPTGLRSIGKGIGVNGEPLRNVRAFIEFYKGRINSSAESANNLNSSTKESNSENPKKTIENIEELVNDLVSKGIVSSAAELESILKDLNKNSSNKTNIPEPNISLETNLNADGEKADVANVQLNSDVIDKALNENTVDEIESASNVVQPSTPPNLPLPVDIPNEETVNNSNTSVENEIGSDNAMKQAALLYENKPTKPLISIRSDIFKVSTEASTQRTEKIPPLMSVDVPTTIFSQSNSSDYVDLNVQDGNMTNYIRKDKPTQSTCQETQPQNFGNIYQKPETKEIARRVDTKDKVSNQTSPNGNAVNKKNDISKADTLIFQNLPPSVSISALASKMREVGELMFSEMTGKGRAVVRFKCEQDALRCMQLFHLSKVDGQIISVTLV